MDHPQPGAGRAGRSSDSYIACNDSVRLVYARRVIQIPTHTHRHTDVGETGFFAVRVSVATAIKSPLIILRKSAKIYLIQNFAKPVVVAAMWCLGGHAPLPQTVRFMVESVLKS